MSKQDKWAATFQHASNTVSKWREKHPRATFTDIENRVDEQLARVRTIMIQDLALESELTDLRQLAPEARPKCPECGRPLAANGTQSRQLITNHEQNVKLERSKGYCRRCRISFFPLDEELQLLPGQYTPQIQEAMTRLGSKMPYEQAVEEVWLNQHTCVEESTLRGTTNRHGKAAEAIIKAEADKLAKEASPAEVKPEQLLVSADGATIRLINGEWREVKTVVVGTFESCWDEQTGAVEVKTKDISYFSGSYGIREFEQFALPELHRRGVFNAGEVVTVNDGADWIQSFADYHFPQATRILDFRHALDHLSDAGRAVIGEGTEAFRPWFSAMAHQLKHKPPQRTIADLCLLQTQANTDEQLAVIDGARRYLQKRKAQIDYPHFQSKGYPIGSGSVESSHKVVVHSRMKQAGMRWADDNIDPMLALRNLVCNGRWSSGWKQIVAFHWEQRRQELREQAKRQRPLVPPITFASVKVAPSVPEDDKLSRHSSQSTEPYRPAPDHPWRRNIWPTKEAWRWN